MARTSSSRGSAKFRRQTSQETPIQLSGCLSLILRHPEADPVEEDIVTDPESDPGGL